MGSCMAYAGSAPDNATVQYITEHTGCAGSIPSLVNDGVASQRKSTSA